MPFDKLALIRAGCCHGVSSLVNRVPPGFGHCIYGCIIPDSSLALPTELESGKVANLFGQTKELTNCKITGCAVMFVLSIAYTRK